MNSKWHIVRTALALPLSALLLAGCFWLEPISQYHPDGGDTGLDGGPRPDGGSDPDGGTEPEPLACGEETPVPAGANVSLPNGSRGWMYLDPGNVLIPGSGRLRMTLSEAHSADVPVELRSSARGIVEPTSEWFCFPPGGTEVGVALNAHAVGDALLEVVVDGVVQASITVSVVDAEPTFTVFPDHGYFNPGESTDITLTLSHPSRTAVTVLASSESGDETYEQGTIPAGSLTLPSNYTFGDAQEVRMRIHTEELTHDVFTEFLRAPSYVLLSEVLMDRDHGFVELYNPTPEPRSLEGLKLVQRVTGPGTDFKTLYTFEPGHSVEPYAYFLLAWGSWGEKSHVNASINPPTDLHRSNRIILGSYDGGSSDPSYTDGIRYETGWVGYGEQSFERKAWATADAEDMDEQENGAYAFAGNAHDRRHGNPDDNSQDDFVLRQNPQPQGAASGTESFFGP